MVSTVMANSSSSDDRCGWRLWHDPDGRREHSNSALISWRCEVGFIRSTLLYCMPLSEFQRPVANVPLCLLTSDINGNFCSLKQLGEDDYDNSVKSVSRISSFFSSHLWYQYVREHKSLQRCYNWSSPHFPNSRVFELILLDDYGHIDVHCTQLSLDVANPFSPYVLPIPEVRSVIISRAFRTLLLWKKREIDHWTARDVETH